MNARQLGWVALFAAVAMLAPLAGARAQGSGRVEDALDLTDRRIELAESLVPAGDATAAAAELALAKQVQGRARTAFQAGQYGIAEKSTLEARGHADRAIAIVRGLPDPDRVLVQVERTRELAERARERLADCTETRARALLRVGFDMQSRAEGAVRESRHLAALQLTLSARERMLKAMRVCKVSESAEELARRALQRTDERISRAREVVDGAAPPEARREFERAVGLQNEAQSEFRAGRHEAALRLTHAARLAADRVLRPGRELRQRRGAAGSPRPGPGGGPPPGAAADRPGDVPN
jgi:tetratricopeptide (TPR) repeat protein